jgi:hypothetical protein
MDFGVFYTCYKEIEAVDYSIKVLKEIYPSCPVYLVSDGGSDYSFLEKKYTHIKTVNSYDSRGISQNLTPAKWQPQEMRDKVYTSIIEFFNRNIDAINFCQTDAILIMEPDVLVRGRLNIYPHQNAALLGSRVNVLAENGYGGLKNIQSILNKIPNCKNVTHYGSTPAFYFAPAMKQVYEFVKQNPNILKEFINCDPAFVCYDVFLTVLFGACGYDEVFNSDIIECLRAPNWEHTHHPLVHQFRRLYPASNTGYDGRHANENF